jgi:alanyl aminopeptidase
VFLAGLSGSVFAVPAPEPPKLRLGDAAQPASYAVDLTVIPNHDTFRGIVDIEVNVRTPAQVLWLNATHLAIQAASFRSDAGAVPLKVLLGGGQFAGFAFDHPVYGHGVLHIAYKGKISRNNSSGLFQMKEDGRWYVYSQFEATDARRAFPCFDEPSFKVPWQITLHVPEHDVALSNTPVLSESAGRRGMKTVKFKASPPLSSYLVALAVGPFDIVDAGQAGKTPVRVIVPHGKAPEAQPAAAAIPQLLRLLEKYCGMPYPYEKLDSVVMPISNFAMENAGLITYGESMLLAKPEVDTLNRQREMATFCAHEMAHQWFGDLVTTAWWDDTWLNEAFATWMETRITGEWKPDWGMDVSAVSARVGAMHLDQLTSARKVRQPIESYDDIENAFDDITYQKGAAVIEMFEKWIGPEKFRDGVRLYLKQHAWGNATAADFEAAISAVAGRNVAPAFDSFLDQAGVPEISVALDCGAKPKVALEQKRSLPAGSAADPQIWQIPVCMAYESGGTVQHQCDVLSERRAEVVLKSANTCPAWLLADDGETGYYQADYQGGLLKDVLAGHGSHLTAAERVGVLGDVSALTRTGEISPRVALELVPEFSHDPNWQVVEAAAGIAELLKGEDVPVDLRAKGVRFIRQQFGDRAMALGWIAKPAESDDTRLLRQKLVPFVAAAGEQKELVDVAEILAAHWLKDRSGVTPEMLGPVLNVAAEFGTPELFQLLREAAVAERDHLVRERLIDALGSFRNPSLARASLDLLLSKDFDARESFYPLLFGPLSYIATRDLPFQFVKQHLDQLLARVPREVGDDYAASLPQVGGAFCDAAHRAELDAFFSDRVKNYTGGPRTLAQTLEGIDRCVAQRQKRVPELEAFLGGY